MKVLIVPILGVALILAACERPEPASMAEPEALPNAASPSPASPPATANAAVFDLTTAPISTASIGDFPYVAVPTGYEIYDDRTLDLAGFPIWTGAAFQTVEGRTYMAQSKVPEGKSYSRLEFERGIESAVKALGGVRVSRGVVPSEAFEDLPRDVTQDASLGLGDRYGNPITTYVIRRADRMVWVQVVAGQSSASWAVVDAPLTTS